MYDITSEEEICDIAEELLKDKDFIERDKKNKNWRSGSLIYYVCFIKTRSYFLKKHRNHQILLILKTKIK